MIIIPAIDIRNGKCVRLTQGNFEKEKIYSNDPVTQAIMWEKQGAEMLHVVDLDGAKNGTLVNVGVIRKIAQTVTIPIQVGGGIRNKKKVETLVLNGIARVILGTVALEDQEELKKILKDYTSQIAVALDAKDGILLKQGWLETSNKNSIETALKLVDFGVQRFIYTDTSKDGTLTTPNYKEISTIIKKINIPVIASGGISSTTAIKKLKEIGVEGVIIGKALYEGKMTIKEALYAC